MNPYRWVVGDVRINGWSQLSQSGDLPGLMFSPAAIEGVGSFDQYNSLSHIGSSGLFEIILRYVGSDPDGEVPSAMLVIEPLFPSRFLRGDRRVVLLESHEAIEPGATARVSATLRADRRVDALPDRPFQIERMAVPYDVGRFDVIGMRIGDVPQRFFDGCASAPASRFALPEDCWREADLDDDGEAISRSFGVDIQVDSLAISRSVSLDVENIGITPARFTAILVGRFMDEENDEGGADA